MLHEAELQRHAGEAVADRRDHGALRVRHPGNLRNVHRDQENLLVEHVVVAEILGQREWYPLPHATHHHGGAGQAKRRIGAHPSPELFHALPQHQTE
jgi:hypothetical protein